MHIEYAKEVLEYNKEQAKKHNWNVDVNLFTVEGFIKEKEFIKLVEEKGCQKSKDIMQTIKDNSSNRYFKVTDAMKKSVASDILNKLSIEEVLDCFNKRAI